MGWNYDAEMNLRGCVDVFRENVTTTLYFRGGQGQGRPAPLIFDDREAYIDVNAEVEINARIKTALVKLTDLENIAPAVGDEISVRGERLKIIDFYAEDGGGYILTLGET